MAKFKLRNFLKIRVKKFRKSLNASRKTEPKTTNDTFKKPVFIFQDHIRNWSKNQDYYKLKENHSKDLLFTDAEFPPNNQSVFYTDKFREWLHLQSRLDSNRDVIWRRAKDMIPESAFVADKNGCSCIIFSDKSSKIQECFKSTGLTQGYVGNCWFVAAACGVIENVDLLQKVIPLDNSFADDQYCGLFHFRFWIYGQWYDVCVDDYLPMGRDGSLNFCHNTSHPNEFWCALLEKAYAKLNGSYEALEGGFTTEALVDMSGGVEETFDLPKINRSNEEEREAFWLILIQAREKKSVICCNLEAESDSATAVQLQNGLVKGHAYVVSALATLLTPSEQIRLVKCINPWGIEIEWNKFFAEWQFLDNSVKEHLMNEVKSNGHFWIKFTSWLEHFDTCQIVNLTPESIFNFDLCKLGNLYSKWFCYAFHSKWISNVNSGGRGEENVDNFFLNPQFLVIVTNEDTDYQQKYARIIVSLMQKISRKSIFELKLYQFIQFRLFKVNQPGQYLEMFKTGKKMHSSHLARVGSSGIYLNRRDVTKRFHLPPGEYIIIPSTYDKNVSCNFLLRIFSEKPLRNPCSSETENQKLETPDHILTEFEETINKDKYSETENNHPTRLKIIRSKFNFFTSRLEQNKI